MLKDIPPQQLAHAIVAVADGGVVLDPQVARHARHPLQENRELALFTRAERVVAGFVARGLNNREIAGELMLAEGTVENHVSSLLRKLAARDRTVLALRLARALGQAPARE